MSVAVEFDGKVYVLPQARLLGENLRGYAVGKERTPHPAQFPVALIERIVKGSSPEGALLHDPFIGSGTTTE
jgi:DNA modification methylase